ncbi:radical SAM protein [Anoxynatronum sibiricum]|uniref:Radical SAM protein n=2 Tax=Anoxynatronum sibiricum TaxID=210623 RepID=A0ABU9VTL0_9CLOT
MKVLLCNVSHRNNEHAHDYAGLFYLAGALEQEGFQPLVYHGQPENLLAEVTRNQPEAVGFSCDFDNVQIIESLSRKIKEGHDIPIVVGGANSMALGRDFLATSGADYVLRGECERSLPMLFNAILKKQGDISEVRGLAMIRNGVLVETPPDIIDDLDTLPLPAYHTSMHPHRSYGSTILTGRGCPFSCAYCAPSPGKRKVRKRSIFLVLEEIKINLKNNPALTYLVIMDDIFTMDRQRIEVFCEGMREIRKERDLIWYCECHVGQIKTFKEVLPTMIDAGLIRLQIGIESGDQEVIDQYNKHIKVHDVIDFVTYAADCGLAQMATNFIVGGPKEKAGATAALIETLMDRAPGVIDIITGFLRAYPGAGIFENPEKYNLQLHDQSGRQSGDDYPFVTPVGCSQEQVMKQRQELNRLIRLRMQQKIKNHEMKVEAVMKQYQAALKYGISSRWFKEISANPRAYEYYYVLYLEEGQAFVESLDFSRDYPQRTFELWRSITFSEGFPQLDGIALSPLEYELLLRCAGKRSLETIEAELYGLYGKFYESQNEFHGKLVEVLFQFDAKYWLTHFILD